VDPLNLEDDVDAVAISFKSLACARAYKLADYYRSKNVKVILGGVHTTLVPEETSQHADSIVIGECEEVLPQLVDDLKNGDLKKAYKAGSLADLSQIPLPKFEIINHKKYLCHSIQTSRGCSLDCEFCPTRQVFGGTFRVKPIKNVIAEIKKVLEIEKKFIFFTDDIFGAGKKDYILELLPQLKKLKIDYMLISDYQVLDKEIVLALARNRCRKLCINMLGTCLKEEVKAIRAIQSLGIDVWGYFGFGFKFQTKDVFRRVLDFIEESRLTHASFAIMAPYPNTPMAQRLEKDKRIFSKDWTLYDQSHVVFKPDLMDVEDLQKGFEWVWEEKKGMTKIPSYYFKQKGGFAIAIRMFFVSIAIRIERLLGFIGIKTKKRSK